MNDLFDTPANSDSHLHGIMLAMALLWTPSTRTTIYQMLRLLEIKDANGRYPTHEELQLSIQQLLKRKLIAVIVQRHGYYQLAKDQRTPLYEELLDTIGSNRPQHHRPLMEPHRRRPGHGPRPPHRTKTSGHRLRTN